MDQNHDQMRPQQQPASDRPDALQQLLRLVAKEVVRKLEEIRANPTPSS